MDIIEIKWKGKKNRIFKKCIKRVMEELKMSEKEKVKMIVSSSFRERYFV